MRIPTYWRPLRIRHSKERGELVVGDTEQAIAQVQWWTPPERRFDVEHWMERRAAKVAPGSKPESPAPGLEKEGTGNAGKRVGAGHPFDHTLWLPDVQVKGRVSSIWYGYSSEARLVVEVTVNGEIDEEGGRAIRHSVLPSLRASAESEPTLWSVLDVSFESPPGFFLVNHRLHLGDVSLDLECKNMRLMLAQVYPMEIALERRALQKWLRPPGIKRTYSPLGKRRFYAEKGVEAWCAKSSERNLEGILCEGCGRLPFPFRRYHPVFRVEAVLCDSELNRLLLASSDAPESGRDMVTDALGAMNSVRRTREEA
jgi:hypothetical protein